MQAPLLQLKRTARPAEGIAVACIGPKQRQRTGQNSGAQELDEHTHPREFEERRRRTPVLDGAAFARAAYVSREPPSTINARAATFAFCVGHPRADAAAPRDDVAPIRFNRTSKHKY